MTLEREVREECVRKFESIYDEMIAQKRSRTMNELRFVVIFFCLRMKHVSFKKKAFLEYFRISYDDFRREFKFLHPFFPEYRTRERKKDVMNLILSGAQELWFPADVYPTSIIILNSFWHYLKYTIEEVTAATVCCLIKIKLDIEDVTLKEICNEFGIAASTVQYQVKNKLFKHFHFEGFKGLLNSAHLIKKLLMYDIDE